MKCRISATVGFLGPIFGMNCGANEVAGLRRSPEDGIE